MKFDFMTISKLPLLALALLAFSVSSCDDDDDLVSVPDDADDAAVFLSSNTSGRVGIVGVADNNLELVTIPAAGTDADGIYYDEDDDELFQVNRSGNELVSYDNVDLDLDRDNIDRIGVDFRSSSDFINGRGLAVTGDRFVVAQDDDDNNKLVAYDADDNEFRLVGTYNVDINLWGIQFVGDDLYAVSDNTNEVVVYENFFGNNDQDSISPSRTIAIEGLTRTHGLEYDETDDIMILTDVGDGSDDSDGAIYVIRNFSSRTDDSFDFDDDNDNDLTRFNGNNTFLGNPVDVDYDPETNVIYVAERANNGGRLLLFDIDAEDNAAPIGNVPFEGLSSLYFYRD